ncbi:MAG: YggT family protein [Candidatus Dormibacteraeota bacterium]|nr:YggT family protein [Candidatus Dormibacteraeota bacterium]
MEPFVDSGGPADGALYDPRLEKAVWFVVGLLGTLIGLRFLMKLFGASYQADFVRALYGVTGVLIAPFRGIFQASGSGNYILEPECLIAVAIYVLIGWAAVSLIRIIRKPVTRATRP